MSNVTCSATPLEAVMVEARPDGMASDVWLRRNITRDVADNGPDASKSVEFYKADEIHFVQAGAPAVEEVEAAFDELWAAHEDDGLSDAERIAKIAARLEETQVALMEIGDLIGGE